MKKKLLFGSGVALFLTQVEFAASATCKAHALSPVSVQTAVYDLPRRFQVGQM